MIQQPIQSSDPSKGMIVTPSILPDRWLLIVRGMAQVMVEDQQGRRIGPIEGQDYPYLIENLIPGASYKPGQFFSSVFLTEPGIYTFIFMAPRPDQRSVTQASDSVHISLSLYNAVSKFHTFFFQGVPMAERSQARLVYTTAEQSAMPLLALDREGSGEIERIQPTILGPQASEDMVPPTTAIDISDNLVTVSAADNHGGAGVWRTYYTTDGIKRAIYTEPFPLPPDAKIVMAYSEDRAGNLEYPGAVQSVLGLSESHIVMKVSGTAPQEPVRHTVNVVNLDPISVTSQLEWVAEADVPWLSVEPRAGTTPYSITLSVRSADLTSGSHEAMVLVRSRTTGTVFAERAIYVRVENPTPQEVRR
jgi:hypothetical protein